MQEILKKSTLAASVANPVKLFDEVEWAVRELIRPVPKVCLVNTNDSVADEHVIPPKAQETQS